MNKMRLLASSLALALAGLSPLGAQEAGFYKDLKVRVGYSPEAKDNLRQSSIGFGFNVGYASSVGKWGVELGYYYKTGDQYIQPVDTHVPDGLSPVDTNYSGDSRRNQLDGLTVRLSFEKPIDEIWSWQAGLMLGGTRFKHEYVGDVCSQDWTSTNHESWRDTYSGTPTKGGLKISPYAGVSFAVSDHSSIELNVLVLNYTALEYQHHAGSGDYAFSTVTGAYDTVGRIADHNAFPSDRLAETNRYVPQLEFGYAIHF